MKQGIKSILITMLICAAIIAAGCDAQKPAETQNGRATGSIPPDSQTSAPENTQEGEVLHGYKFSKYDMADSWDETAVTIDLNHGDVKIQGSGASISGKRIIIQKEGTYVISGDLPDGQLVVDVEKSEKVHLVLMGAAITCSDSAAIYVKSADKTVITLAEGTVNTMTDGSSYTFETPEKKKPNACIYSADDLTINGTGALTVKGNYNNGIATKNDLKIISGKIHVEAVNNAMKGKDSLAVKGGNLTVKSQDDGLKSDNDMEAERGCVYIFGGDIQIEAGDDSIQAYTKVLITDGTLRARSGGKNINCDGVVEGEERIQS